MTAAMIDGLSESEYRALPGLSGTGVAKLLASPADYAYDLANPEPPNASMSLGTLVHAMVLGTDPHMTVAPYKDFRTKEAREWKAEAEAHGLIIITASMHEQAEKMCDAVMDNQIARTMLEAPGDSEVTVTGEHKGAGVKGRIDRLTRGGPIVDLKTTRDPSPAAMSRFIGDYGTATQLAHYARIVGISDQRPYVIAVRNQNRPAVAVYQIAELTWAVANAAVERAWDTYAECVATDVWPDPYATEVHDLDLRPWAMDALEDIDEMEVS